MSVVHSMSRAERIALLFDGLMQKLGGLSGELRDELQHDLGELRTSINDLIHTRGEEESASRKEYLQAVISESEARYRELGESLSDPLSVFGADLRLIYRNPAAQQASRISQEAAFGKTFEELYPNQVGSGMHQAFLRAVETQKVQTYLNRWIRPDNGQISYYEISYYPGREWLVVISKDVTERENALADLRESEERFRTVWEITTDAMALSDAEGIVTAANPAYYRLYGYSAKEVLGRNFSIIFPEEVRQSAEQEYREVFCCEPAPERFVSRIRRKDGVERVVETHIAFIEREGNRTAMLSVIHDITERTHAEEELLLASDTLRESEGRFRAMADGTPVIIWVTDGQGQIEFINKAYSDFFGVTIEVLKQKRWQMLVHPEDTERYVDVYMECLREQKPFRAQGRVLRHDGKWHWVDSQGQPRFSDTGEFLGMAGSSIDITEQVRTQQRIEEELEERKQAEAALAKAHIDLINERNRLLAAMEALPMGLAIYDENGGIVQANPSYEAVWRSPRPKVNTLDDYEMYKAWWVQTGKRVQPEEWASSKSIVTGEPVIGQYLRIMRFDGTFGYVLNSGAPVRDADGKIIGGAVAIMDITERVEMEKALEEAQNRFRVALSSVPLLMFTCDRDLRTTWIYNPPQGYRADDVMGKRDDEVLPPQDVVELMAIKQHALDTGQGGIHEIKMNYGGEERYYILTTDPIRDGLGEVTGLTCASIDITVQKRMEIERQEVQMKVEVQRRLMDQREKERMGIARDIHDGPIQTLASTAFNIQLLKESYPDPTLMVELNQIALNVKSAVRELREVVNDLRPPSIIRFGLTRAIMMHAEDLRERYPETELELELDEDGARLSDQACLTVFRVFQEGMNNIFHHAVASKVQVKYAVTGAQFVLEIHDNGSGFTVPKDFANLTIDGHFGLAGMKERVEAVGGAFTITSEPGKGTTITVKGPLVEG